MITFKGTKGPWKPYYTRMLDGLNNPRVYEIVVMPDRRQASQHVALSWDINKVGRNGGLTFEEAEANAHLIAAAPDLLAACQEFIAFFNDLNIPIKTGFLKHIHDMDKAINKALTVPK
jgi:hypothetical protein